jgi:hypothetical protein
MTLSPLKSDRTNLKKMYNYLPIEIGTFKDMSSTILEL